MAPLVHHLVSVSVKTMDPHLVVVQCDVEVVVVAAAVVAVRRIVVAAVAEVVVLVIVVVIKIIRRKEHLLFVPTSFSFCSVFVYILIGNNNKQTINLSFSFFFEDTFR